MPRYFFHQYIDDVMIWDRVGLELPNLRMAPWADILSRKLQPGQILVVTDTIGQLRFVTAKGTKTRAPRSSA